MTYKPEPDFSMPTAKLANLKKESIQRSQRILKILRTAFAEAVAEIQDSRTVFSSLVKEATAETVVTIRSKIQQISDTSSQAWQQRINHKALIEKMVAFTYSCMNTAKSTLFPQIKGQAQKLETVFEGSLIEGLRQRCGHRYENIKEQFEVVRSWYVVPETTTARKQNNHSSDSTVIIEVKSEVIH